MELSRVEELVVEVAMFAWPRRAVLDLSLCAGGAYDSFYGIIDMTLTCIYVYASSVFSFV